MLMMMMMMMMMMFRCITGIAFNAVFVLSMLSFYGQLLEQLNVASLSRLFASLLIVTVILWANK